MSHTTWPTITDVSALVSAMGGTVTAGTAIQDSILDAVIQTVNLRTHRTWIPTTTTRYYNGNDQGEIEIDEFITISTIELIGWFGVTTGLELSNFAPIENRPGYPNTRLQIYRGSIPAFYRHWVDRFPSGRQNLKITGIFGYATTIPDDLWWGVAAQAAGIHLNMLQYGAQGTAGFLIKWAEADVTEVRNALDPFKFVGIPYGSLKALIKVYKKPDSYLFRKRQRVLV